MLIRICCLKTKQIAHRTLCGFKALDGQVAACQLSVGYHREQATSGSISVGKAHADAEGVRRGEHVAICSTRKAQYWWRLCPASVCEESCAVDLAVEHDFRRLRAGASFFNTLNRTATRAHDFTDRRCAGERGCHIPWCHPERPSTVRFKRLPRVASALPTANSLCQERVEAGCSGEADHGCERHNHAIARPRPFRGSRCV